MSKKTKKIIVDYFSQKPEVAAVYLYGSRARGDAREDSDIDLGILMVDKHKYRGLDNPQFSSPLDLSKLTGKGIEIQDLESCRVDFAHRVITEGELLIVNNDKTRIEFEETTLRNYFDLKPLFDEYYKSLSERAGKGEIGVRSL